MKNSIFQFDMANFSLWLCNVLQIINRNELKLIHLKKIIGFIGSNNRIENRD